MRLIVCPLVVRIKINRQIGMDLICYENSQPILNTRLKQITPSWLTYFVEFPTARPTLYIEDNTMRDCGIL